MNVRQMVARVSRTLIMYHISKIWTKLQIIYLVFNWPMYYGINNVDMFSWNFYDPLWSLKFSQASNVSIVEQMIIEVFLSFEHFNVFFLKCLLKVFWSSNTSSPICSIVKWSLWSSWVLHSIAYKKLCIKLISFIWFSTTFSRLE